jgi:coenzyme F420-reducing hydrogenase alpha subunit
MARKLAKDLDKPARDGVALPPGPRSVLTFRVEVENGTVRFSDTSRAITPAMRRMQSFTRDVAKRVCGLAR